MSSVFSIKNLVRTLSLSVPLTLIFFDNIAYIARVDGVSMQPTLNPCDYDENNFNDNDNTDGSINIKNLLFNRFNSSDLIWLSHWATRNYQIERGYIVSLISPNNPNQIIIKRVIGVEGDTVVTRRNFKFETIRIPKGHCWVEGDNHTKSMDSNIFGPVSVGLITAQAKYIIWPPKRWQSLTKQMPNDRIYVVVKVSSKSFKFPSIILPDPCIIELNVDPLSSSIVQHHHSPSSTSSSSKLGLITTILDEDSF
uniref:Mitochondrial inner membrane protease subunit 2 n=1 Tax=Dermatophagoides pteronyssinus TaxID=6956 RepID=A0A6P6YIK4_DERPT|nr:mitochondrial inner membrane protease subunit 2-like [Dermatophagoides pteronyssinus]